MGAKLRGGRSSGEGEAHGRAKLLLSRYELAKNPCELLPEGHSQCEPGVAQRTLGRSLRDANLMLDAYDGCSFGKTVRNV